MNSELRGKWELKSKDPFVASTVQLNSMFRQQGSGKSTDFRYAWIQELNSIRTRLFSLFIKLYIGRLFPSGVTGSSMFKPAGRRCCISPADPLTWTGPDSFCLNGVTWPCSKQPLWPGGCGRLNGVGLAHCPFLEPGWQLCPLSHID